MSKVKCVGCREEVDQDDTFIISTKVVNETNNEVLGDKTDTICKSCYPIFQDMIATMFDLNISENK